jgi:quinol monooxygenase YgiN
MLVIAGHIRLDPSKREAAIAAGKVMMEATRKEAGCAAYVFSADVEDDGVIHLFEQWESQEALAAHFKAPHMAAFQKAIPGFGVREMSVQRYEVSSVGPLR